MQAFRNLKTFTKLLVSFGLVTALVVVVGVMAYRTIETQSAAIQDLAVHGVPGAQALGDLDGARLRAGRDVRTAMIVPDPEQTARYAELATAHARRSGEILEQAMKVVNQPEILANLGEIKTLYPQWSEAITKLGEVAKRHDTAGFLAELDLAMKDVKRIDDLLDASSKLERETAARQATELAVASQAAERNLLILVVGCAVAAFLLAFVVGRAIAGPLQQTVAVLEQVRERDLTARLQLEGKDEVGEMSSSLDTALEQMQSALCDVREVSDGLAGAASEMAAAATDISSGAQEQASQLEETAASLEQITATVKASADNARQASQLAVGARETAERGGQVVEQAVAAMNEINNSSKRIADIITTIDEIAFQTNLLALNAAVEAARAGEQGRGFAVVASEVRTLAQRSATAAKEIKGLIQDSVQKVESGSELVNRSGQTLQEIVSSVRRVADIVDEMSAAAREQSAGVDQVNTAVTQMDQVTQSSAAQTEEMSATAESLNDQAGKLKALVAQFRLEEGARRQPAAAPARAASRPSVKKPLRRPTKSGRKAPVSVSIPTFVAKGNGKDKKGSAAMDDFMSGTGDSAGEGFFEA